MKVFAQISISGSRRAVEGIAAVLSNFPVSVNQIGLKRKIPEVNHWHISSPMYRFRWGERLDDEIFDFLCNYEALKNADVSVKNEVIHAFLNICPVRESEAEEFSCVLSQKTLKKILSLGLSFQLAPALVMPDFQYWIDV